MKKDIRARVAKARKVYEDIKQIIHARDLVFWEEARLFYELKKDQLFRYVHGESGTDAETEWKGFLAEFGIPLSTIDQRIRTYEFYVVRNRVKLDVLNRCNTRKLGGAITAIEEGEASLIDVLEQAQNSAMSLRDFNIWLKGGAEPCWHNSSKRKRITEQVEVCADCGKHLRVPRAKKVERARQ